MGKKILIKDPETGRENFNCDTHFGDLVRLHLEPAGQVVGYLTRGTAVGIAHLHSADTLDTHGTRDQPPRVDAKLRRNIDAAVGYVNYVDQTFRRPIGQGWSEPVQVAFYEMLESAEDRTKAR